MSADTENDGRCYFSDSARGRCGQPEASDVHRKADAYSALTQPALENAGSHFYVPKWMAKVPTWDRRK